MWPNGEKGIIYTTKKPNWRKIRQNAYTSIKSVITNYPNTFKSFGMEGFLDQSEPDLCICFSENEAPGDLIADWNAEMITIPIYDFQFNHAQLNRCVKIIAEIIVELAEEDLLRGKTIYFHQNQMPVTDYYINVKNVFKKAQIDVK